MSETNNETEMLKANNSWDLVFSEIRSNLNKPWKDFTFVGYFFVFIVILGGFSIWIELFSLFQKQTLEGLMKALLTFSLAISSATLADLVLHNPEKREITRPISEPCRFAFQALGILIVVASCLLLFSEASFIRLMGSSLISFLTLMLWWNTNSYNPILNPSVDEFDEDPSTALGSTEDVSDRSAETKKYQY